MVTKSKYDVPKMVRGRVSDIKVFDNFNPLTGEGKLVDYNKGGDNTITSGASFNLLVWAFMCYSQQSTRYVDVNGYQFPHLFELTNTYGTGSSNPPIWYSPAKNLFGNIVGLKGASGGIPAHQTSLSNLQSAWWLQSINSGNADMASSNPFSVWAGFITCSVTPSVYSSSSQNNGIPAISLNVTVTSTSSAQAYTIDSIAWSPMKSSPGTSSTSSGYWTLSTSNPSFNSSAPTTSSASTSPTTLNNLAISALYVLPYSVTVNPNGALQFTYTFQGN